MCPLPPAHWGRHWGYTLPGDSARPLEAGNATNVSAALPDARGGSALVPAGLLATQGATAPVTCRCCMQSRFLWSQALRRSVTRCSVLLDGRLGLRSWAPTASKGGRRPHRAGQPTATGPRSSKWNFRRAAASGGGGSSQARPGACALATAVGRNMWEGWPRGLGTCACSAPGDPHAHASLPCRCLPGDRLRGTPQNTLLQGAHHFFPSSAGGWLHAGGRAGAPATLCEPARPVSSLRPAPPSSPIPHPRRPAEVPREPGCLMGVAAGHAARWAEGGPLPAGSAAGACGGPLARMARSVTRAPRLAAPARRSARCTSRRRAWTSMAWACASARSAATSRWVGGCCQQCAAPVRTHRPGPAGSRAGRWLGWRRAAPAGAARPA